MNRLYTMFCFAFFTLTAIISPLMAQNRPVNLHGEIKITDGEPAALVTVSLLNTNRTTATNHAGEFLLKHVLPGKYMLKISAIGMSSQEQEVTVTSGINKIIYVTVSESAAQLADVAVRGYVSPNRKPVKLGKVDIAPLDLPQAVQIIGTEVIQDQQVNKLSDVLQNVNGVAYAENRGSVSGETFYARGYSLGKDNVFKNGSRASTGGMPETSSLQSVEVLKGSAALLYGGVTGGAVVNLITKKPEFDHGGEVSLRGGSYDMYKPIGDIYGPISKNLAFRLIGSYEGADSYRNDVNSKRTYINPSLLYKLGEKTEILLQGDYLKSDFTPDFGIGTIDNKIVNIGRGTFLNAPWAYNNTNTVSTQLNVDHTFNQRWKINVIANFQSYNRDYFSAERPFADASGVAARNVTRSKTREFSYNQQINLSGRFKTGEIAQTLLIGADADQLRTTSNGFLYADGKTAFNYGNINLLDPSTYFGSGIEPEANNVSRTLAPVYRMGVFAQDLIAISSKFKVLAGIRYTTQKTANTRMTDLVQNKRSVGVNAQTDGAFSPKAALIYQPLKTTSLYVSYANSFITNSGTDIYSAPLDPSLVDQFEAGVKNDFLQGRLSVNLTVYKILNDKYAQQALFLADGSANADRNIKELNTKTASDGVELDVTGNIVEGLNFLAGYSYNYIRFTSTLAGSGVVEGERLVGSTKHTANGTLFYTFNGGWANGLKLGTSAFYTGFRNGGRNTKKDGTSTGVIPLAPFTTFDFTAGYSWNKISLLAKVSNIGNELNYFVHENYSVNPIAPRQFITTLSYRF
ncbi:iron complex outermembrane receptor protein [Pedobacter sp. UYEF25]